MSTFGPLVTTDWLADDLGRASLKLIDGSWRMPGMGAAIDNYHAQHISGAVFFDIDAIADKTTDLPHMLPTPEQFAAAVGDMGISENDDIVVYDEKGVFSAARVWWTFRAMGHPNVAVLDGGLPKWLSEHRPVTAGETILTPTKYHPRPAFALVASAGDVQQALKNVGATVADARPADRFAGQTPEPRPGLRSGHMPGAVNIPYDRLLTPSGVMRRAVDIRQIFEEAGVNSGARVITSCGSGVTAAILSLALEVIGARNHAVYDGSWADWGDETHDSAVYPVVVDQPDQQSG